MAIPTQFGAGLPGLMGGMGGQARVHPAFQPGGALPQTGMTGNFQQNLPQILQGLQQRFANHPQGQQIMQMIMSRIGQMGLGGGQVPQGMPQGMQGLFGGQMPTNFQPSQGMNWPGMNTTGA